jgi:hypothetical protein
MNPSSHSDAIEPDVLDGNTAAGVLRQIFACDVTSAQVICAGCGNTYAVATLKLYGLPMGHILRCPGCQLPLIRLVARELECWLDMAGVRSLRLSLTQ